MKNKKEELPERVRGLGDSLPTPPPPRFGPVEGQAKRIRLRRQWVPVLVAALSVAAIAVPLAVMLPLGDPTEKRSPVPAALPEVAQVKCDGSSTELGTPRVRPRSDGVHFQVENQTEQPLTFHVRGSEGRLAPPGRSEMISPLAPGPWRILCFQPNAEPSPQPEGDAQLEVVDEAGLWRSIDVPCSRRVGVIGGDAPLGTGIPGAPLDAATSYFRTLARDAGEETFPGPRDVIERAGYPEEDPPRYRIVREGEVIGQIKLGPDGEGGWFAEEALVCVSS